MRRRELLASLTAALGAATASHAMQATDPWTQEELMEPSALARRIEGGNAPPILCVAFASLYKQRHIRGALFAGPGNKPEGIESLVKAVRALDRGKEIVLYCGCCPPVHCPNIRPAFEAVKREGFKKVRVLHIPANLRTDWTAKGYPSEPAATEPA